MPTRDIIPVTTNTRNSSPPQPHDHINILPELDTTTNWIGDQMITPKPNRTLRLMFQNLNSIGTASPDNNMNILINEQLTTEIDVLGITEHCINTNQGDTYFKIRSSVRNQITEKTFLQLDSSSTATETSYLPGGTGIVMAGDITGRLDSSGSGGDPAGRWSYIHLRRKGKRPLTVFSVYQVNARPTNQIGTTAWHQQRLFLDKQKRTESPRQAFIHDLTIIIRGFQQQDHDIIVGGDFNETSTKTTSGLLRLITNTGLIDTWNHRFPSHPEFNSYSRGSSRIDTILCSPSLAMGIKNMGYSPFQWFTNSDHRALFIDLSLHTSIDQDNMQSTKLASRSIKSNDHKNVQVFVNKFYDHMMQNNADTLLKDINRRWATVDEVERFDKLITQAMDTAEKACRRRRKEFYSVSINALRIKTAISQGIVNQLRQQILPSFGSFQTRLDRANLHLFLHDNLQDATRQLRELRKELKMASNTSIELREAELSARIHEKHAKGSLQHMSRLISIKKGEATKRAWRVLKNLKNNKGQTQTLTQLEIPDSWPEPDDIDNTPGTLEDPKTCTKWRTVTDPQQMDHYLRLRNRGHFGQAHGTPFTETPLKDLIDWTADTQFTESILNGSCQLDTISSIPQCQALLDACKLANTLDMLPVHITDKEFAGKIQSWRESTTTSPSGRHLGKYKALFSKIPSPTLTEDNIDDAATILQTEKVQELIQQQKFLRDAILSVINYCLFTGHVLERWKTIVNMMIFKETGDFRIHRLRVIHIYEADFNLILAVKWRQLLHSTDSKNMIHNGLFGGRPGHEAQSLTLLEELKYDISIMARRTLFNFDNDATSCYDRIIVALASLIHRKYGMHRKVVAVHSSTLQQARFHLRTTTGISDQFYTHSIEFPIYGSGQGSGNSPCIWLFISSILCEIHQETAYGASFMNVQGNEEITIPIVGFVDDCTGTFNDFRPHQEDDLQTMTTKMQHDAQVWNDLLWCSGGKLELPKCSFHILRFKFKPDGGPVSILDPTDYPIHIQDSQTGDLIPIRPNKSDEPHKTLGHWKAPSHRHNTKQLQALSTKAEHTTNLIATAALSRHGALQAYFGIYIASLKYVLPQCHFTHTQLNNAEQKSTSIILAKCGFNRHTPRPIRYAPTSYAGCGMIPWWVLQGEGHMTNFIKHWRSESIISSTLRIATSWCQWQSGLSTSWLIDTRTPLPHLEAKWCTSLRESLSKANITIELDQSYITPPERNNDVYIMEWAILHSELSTQAIKILNYCRLHLHVTTISELFDIQGSRILPHAYDCRRPPWFNLAQMGPLQPRPSNSQVTKIWKPFCDRWQTKINNNSHTFGTWTHEKASWRAFRQEQIVPPPPDLQEQRIVTAVHSTSDPTISTTKRPQHRCPHFEAYVGHLDTWERHLLKHTMFGTSPQGIVTHLKTMDHTSNQLLGILNQSFQRSAASFGWSLTTADGACLAECHGPSQGPPSRSRADAWCALSITRFLFHLYRHTMTPLPIPSITILSRNVKVIRILSNRPTFTRTYCNETISPDWDIFEQTYQATLQLQGDITWKSLMDHKKDLSERDIHVQQRFSQHESDSASCTKEFLQDKYERLDVSPFLPAGRCLAHHNNTTTIHRKYTQSYRDSTLIPALHQYLTSKFQWEPHTTANIEWIWFENAVKQYHHASRNHLTKLLYDQLATPARLKKQGGQTWANDTCPHCTNTPETFLHMLQCNHEAAVRFRTKLVENVTHICIEVNAPLDFIQTLLHALAISLNSTDNRTAITPEATILYTKQEAVGWTHLLQGRWTQQWRKYLHTTLQHQEPLRCQYNIFFQKVIISCWNAQTDFWKTYQDQRHARDTITLQSQKHKEVIHTTRFLFTLQQMVLPEHRDVYFPSDPSQFLESSTCNQLTAYVKNYKGVIDISAKRQQQKERETTVSLWQFPGFHRTPRDLLPATDVDIPPNSLINHDNTTTLPASEPTPMPHIRPNSKQRSIRQFLQRIVKRPPTRPRTSGTPREDLSTASTSESASISHPSARLHQSPSSTQRPLPTTVTPQIGQLRLTQSDELESRPRIVHTHNPGTRAHSYKHSKWKPTEGIINGFRKYFRPSG